MSNRELAESYSYLAEFSAMDECYIARVVEWPTIRAKGLTKEAAEQNAVKEVERNLCEIAAVLDVPPSPISFKVSHA